MLRRSAPSGNHSETKPGGRYGHGQTVTLAASRRNISQGASDERWEREWRGFLTISVVSSITLGPSPSPNGPAQCTGRAIARWALIFIGNRVPSSSQPPGLTALSRTPRVSTMKDSSQVLSALNMAIDSLHYAKEVKNTTPVNRVFASVAILLFMIRVSFFSSAMRRSRLTRSQDTMVNKEAYVDLGLSCAHVCKALEREMGEERLDDSTDWLTSDVNQSVYDAINQLMMWVEPAVYTSCSSAYHELDRRTVSEIQGGIMKRSERHRVSRFLRSWDDKNTIAAWKSDLNRILHVFNVCSARSRLAIVNYSTPDRTYPQNSYNRRRYTSGCW